LWQLELDEVALRSSFEKIRLAIYGLVRGIVGAHESLGLLKRCRERYTLQHGHVASSDAPEDVMLGGAMMYGDLRTCRDAFV
jgi:hypothetical protein